MKKCLNYLLVGVIAFLNIIVVKALEINDLVDKLPQELNDCYAKIYNKEAAEDKVNYKVDLDSDMLYITQEKDGRTLFVTGFTITDDVISYEEFYNMDTDYQELETRNKVNYLAIFNVITKLSGYTENYNNKILDILEAGDFSNNGYNLTRDKNGENIKENFKINLNNFVMNEELETANFEESNKGKRITGYVMATIIVVVGLGVLLFLNRDAIFGGKFFK